MNEEEALSALLSIAEEMDTDALDTLISSMAEVRAKKLPAVASTRPMPAEPLSMATTVTIEDSPAMLAARLKDGRIRLWARSSGFGWLAFNLPTGDALLLKDWFNANLDGDSDLLGQSNGPTH